MVLATLTPEQLKGIADGSVDYDALVKAYIHENLSFRFVVTADKAAAFELERLVESGEWGHGKPLLSRFA